MRVERHEEKYRPSIDCLHRNNEDRDFGCSLERRGEEREKEESKLMGKLQRCVNEGARGEGEKKRAKAKVK